MDECKDKIIIPAVEEVTLISEKGNKKVEARIDTGARLSSMDTSLVAELGYGPVVRTKKVKSSHGRSLRPVITAEVEVSGKRVEAEFTFIDRSHMTYPVLIGRNVLKHGFVVDVSKE
jgi:hypothetical protein